MYNKSIKVFNFTRQAATTNYSIENITEVQYGYQIYKLIGTNFG